jgi:penicillin-binding protein 1A
LHYQPDSTCNPADPNCAWNVETYEHTYSGVESVANATLQSDNTVFARLALDVGPKNIVAMARRLGVRTSPLDAVPSITLGSVAVTPLEMASVYATLAAGGVYSKPMAITKVVLPNGKVDVDAGWGKPQRERVIADWVAGTVTKVLEQNMLAGTGRGAHVYNHTDAGKTGTTENYADAWFSGYTPRLEATVWIGFPKAEIPMLSVHGIAVSGPTFPAQIWHDFMTTAIGNRPDVPFPPAQTEPVWTSWHGQWEYSGAYNYSTTTGSSSGGTTSSTTSSGRTTVPAATTQSPPVTTAPAPPPATTETTPAPPPTTPDLTTPTP